MDVNPGEEKALSDIDRYGCHIISVAAEDDLPPFAYSVGIQKSSGKPEVVVIGLKQELAHSIINEYNRRIRKGEPFIADERYSGFLEAWDVIFANVDRSFYLEYFGWDLWLYAGPHFSVLQIIYPTTSGVWPWEPAASEWFRWWQPVLSSTNLSPTTS